MGGFLGIGKSSEEKELERQNQLRQQEAEQARREAEIRLAEKKAKKGQEIANVKLGTKETPVTEEASTGKTKGNLTQVSGSLGLGGKSKTGIQL
jgi:NCAIR mutase (PurE)-related protein